MTDEQSEERDYIDNEKKISSKTKTTLIWL